MASDSILQSTFGMALYFSSELALAFSERLKLPGSRWVQGSLQLAIFSVLMVISVVLILAVFYGALLAWSAIK